VFAERAARDVVQVAEVKASSRAGQWKVPALVDRGAAHVAAERVREIMWRDAGVIRTASGLRAARAELETIERRLPVGATEEENLVQTARLIVEGALRRKESRGGHYRADYPRAIGSWRKRHIEL
jgi:L-aspartate oxidase